MINSFFRLSIPARLQVQRITSFQSLFDACFTRAFIPDACRYSFCQLRIASCLSDFSTQSQSWELLKMKSLQQFIYQSTLISTFLVNSCLIYGHISQTQRQGHRQGTICQQHPARHILMAWTFCHLVPVIPSKLQNATNRVHINHQREGQKGDTVGIFSCSCCYR